MKPSVLYLECHSGISGDMTVAALLDLGADRRVLQSSLESLPLSGYSIEIKDVFKSGIRACDFNVVLDSKHENHDHDMEYLHGHSSHVHAADHAHKPHRHDAHYGHEHPHSHEHHHESRNLSDITQLILAGSLTANAKALAIRIFTILAEAEAKVHGKTLEEVHFHEVGAVDSIVDIVAVAVCLDDLQPSKVILSTLTEGTGQIRCQHGIIPVPVPAVTAIAASRGLRLKFTDIEGELITPTGAAIAAAIGTEEKLPDEFKIIKTGFGAGKRDYKTAGVLRAMLLEPLVSEESDTVMTLETNIDDCSGEAISFTLQQLMKQGALDAFCIPIYMKKSRPAHLLKVICNESDQKKLESIIFTNTTSIGIRYEKMRRTKLKRKIVELETPWGMAKVKICTHNNSTYCYPENDSVAPLAEQNKIGFTEMYHLIQSFTQNNLFS